MSDETSVIDAIKLIAKTTRDDPDKMSSVTKGALHTDQIDDLRIMLSKARDGSIAHWASAPPAAADSAASLPRATSVQRRAWKGNSNKVSAKFQGAPPNTTEGDFPPLSTARTTWRPSARAPSRPRANRRSSGAGRRPMHEENLVNRFRSSVSLSKAAAAKPAANSEDAPRASRSNRRKPKSNRLTETAIPLLNFCYDFTRIQPAYGNVDSNFDCHESRRTRNPRDRATITRKMLRTPAPLSAENHKKVVDHEQKSADASRRRPPKTTRVSSITSRILRKLHAPAPPPRTENHEKVCDCDQNSQEVRRSVKITSRGATTRAIRHARSPQRVRRFPTNLLRL